MATVATTKRVTPKRETNADGVSHKGSGNPFADFGFPDPDVALLKAKIALEIHSVVVDRKLTNAKAAKLVGLETAKLVGIMNGSVKSYTIDRLVQYLNGLGRRVDISFFTADASPQ